MQTAILILLIAVLAVQGVLLRLLLHRGSEPEEKLSEAIKAMRAEEQQLRTEQSAHTNETIRLSMQMVSDNLSQGQTQTRETTAAQLKQFEERIRGLETANARAISALRETVEAQLELLRAHNDKRLREMQKTVDETLQTQLEQRMTESFRRVTDSLEQVYRGLGEMKTLAQDVGGLKRVLSNVKTRGNFGEIRLGSILAEILAPGQYAENVETVPGSNKRVEFALKIPAEGGQHIWLPIDSKFPADAYQQLLDAQESGEKQAVKKASEALCTRLLAFAKDVHEKYVREPETTPFAIMFLPFEGLYAEAVRSGAMEQMQQKYNVMLAGPSTTAALLNALSMGLRTLAIQEQSAQVWQVLEGVRAEFETFEEVLTATKKKLDDAGKGLDTLIGTRTRAINRQLREIGTGAEGAGSR